MMRDADELSQDSDLSYMDYATMTPEQMEDHANNVEPFGDSDTAVVMSIWYVGAQICERLDKLIEQGEKRDE